ncbi:MAG: helix-turn-helix domain-containing protein [Clostridia bacterium]|nr:helix-turn-helix domain-containing protein [Clostridia bacterium]
MESEEQFKKQFGEKISEARKQKGYTQLKLAEKLNYTDKAVSKWERGESVPDTYTVLKIAELLNVSPSYLFGKDETTETESSDKPKKKTRPVALFVPIITSVTVFFIASVLFLVLKLFPVTTPYAPYVYLIALTAMFIELVVFSFIWWSRPAQFTCLSCLIWSVGGTAYSLVRLFTELHNFKYIFICCAMLQIICVIVFIFVHFIIKNRKSQSR